ncbi:MAG: hypothetical protein RIC35_24760 [Marinoscillum sp.]
MDRLIKFFTNKPKYTIKFSPEMNSFVVIKRDEGILYAGPKEQCQYFVQHQS